MSRSILAPILWLSCGLGFAQDRPLVERLPNGMAVDRVMQIAQSALAMGGWRITSNQATTIEAEDGNSKIRLFVADGAIRYTDLAQARRDPWAKGLYESMQQPRRDPIPAQRIADLRAQIVAGLSGNPAAASRATPAEAGQLLIGNLPGNLSNDQILRAVWSALSGRRWIVQPGSGDSINAEYTSGDTAGKLQVFLVGRDLRYLEDGTRQRSSGRPTSLPDNWIANLRADTSRTLMEMSAKKPPAAPANSAIAANPRTVAERLRALKELHDSGVITRDEYDKKRAEILKDL